MLVKVGKFIKGFNRLIQGLRLIITKTGNGTITPSEGIYPTEPNTEVEFTAVESDSDYYFKHWDIDGDLVTTNPYILEVLAETSVDAVFEAWQIIADWFFTVPVLVGSDWVFLGQSTSGNNSKCVNTPIANFYTGTGKRVRSNTLKITGGTVIDLRFKFKIKTITAGNMVFFCGANLATEKGCNLKFNSQQFYFVTADGTTSAFATFTPTQLLINTDYECRLLWDGTGTSRPVLTINGTDFTGSNNCLAWEGESNAFAEIGSRYSGAAEILIAEMNYISLANYFEFLFQERIGTWIYDTSGNGNNFELVGIDNATFFGVTSNTQPYTYTRGCTIYNRTADNLKLAIAMDTSQLITGMTKVAYYPPASGILSELVNTYDIPVNAELNEFITSGAKTWTELDALTGENITKTKVGLNRIARFIVKKKLNETNIIEFNNLTEYNNINTYN